MGRRKRVKLAFITNGGIRKATYKKRLIGLQKKVSELAILCGIEVCSIVYSPFNSQPVVWPNPSGVQQVIERFKSFPEFEKEKKMLDEETIVMQRISKLQEQLNRKYMENRQKQLTELMNQSLVDKSLPQKLMPQNKNDLEWIVDEKLKEVNRRIEAINGGASDQHPVAPALAAPPNEPVMPNIISEVLPRGGIQGQGQGLINPSHQSFTPAMEISSVPGMFVQGGRLTMFLPPS